MSDAHDTNPKRGGLYQLSESSNVRLGLALALVAGVWALATSLAGLRAEIDAKYVSKELFSTRMQAVESQLSDMRYEMRQMQSLLREQAKTGK